MRFINTFILSTFILFLTAFVWKTSTLNALELTYNMFEKTKKIKGLEYVMKKTERINGVLTESYSYTKLIRDPFKIYFKRGRPEEAVLEALYIEGQHDNKAVINPNGFPWFNLYLSPMGSTMRHNQHHTLFDSGYDMLVSILEHLIKKYNQNVHSMITVSNAEKVNGFDCFKLVLDNPHFKYIEYVVKPNENITDIANKFKLSDYMILQKNIELDDYIDVVAGQKLIIPNDYAPKLEIYIDKNKMLPILFKVYDDQGLFEQYEYQNLIIDPAFEEDEFSTTYNEYGF